MLVDAIHAGAEEDAAAAGGDETLGVFVEIKQRDAGDADVGGGASGEKALLEDVKRAGGGDFGDIEIARADDDGGPKAADHALGLAAGGEEGAEGAIVPLGAIGAHDGGAGAGDLELLAEREE